MRAPHSTLIALLGLALAANGCSEPQAESAAVEPVVAETSPIDERLQMEEAYKELVGSIESRGMAGAQAAWDAGKPAVLLFAASS